MVVVVRLMAVWLTLLIRTYCSRYQVWLDMSATSCNCGFEHASPSYTVDDAIYSLGMWSDRTHTLFIGGIPTCILISIHVCIIPLCVQV